MPQIKSKEKSEDEKDEKYLNENKIYISDEEKLIMITNHNGYGVYLITEK